MLSLINQHPEVIRLFSEDNLLACDCLMSLTSVLNKCEAVLAARVLALLSNLGELSPFVHLS